MPIAPGVSPPSQRGWIVVAVTFVNLTLCYGAWYAYSVFLVALLREFGWSRSAVSGVFSTFLIVHGLAAPFVGWLASRFGARRCILSGAVIMGLGLALAAETTERWHLYAAFGGVAAIGVTLAAWIPSIVLVRGWFPHRVGTAVGIASSGIGVGILALVPLTQVVIDASGWRWAFRLFAVAIVAWVLPATAALVREPPSSGAPDTEHREPAGNMQGSPGIYWTLASASRTWRFWMAAGVYFTGNFVTQMLLIHQVAYLVDHGLGALAAASLAGVTGFMSIAGKIGWGALSDRTTRPFAYTLAFTCVAFSIGLLVLAGRHPASLLPYVYAAFIGLGYGAMAPLAPAIASDLFAGPGFSLIFGALYTVGCFGLASGTWTAGWIFDTTGSYAVALWLGLAMAALSPLCMWLAAPSDSPRWPMAPAGQRRTARCGTREV